MTKKNIIWLIVGIVSACMVVAGMLVLLQRKCRLCQPVDVSEEPEAPEAPAEPEAAEAAE